MINIQIKMIKITLIKVKIRVNHIISIRLISPFHLMKVTKCKEYDLIFVFALG